MKVQHPWTTACVFALVTACSAQQDRGVSGEPGTHLPGLTPEQVDQFNRGATLFHKQFTPEEGLGPLFNQRRCSSCHDLPANGGTGVELVTKATRFDSMSGTCDLLTHEGGDNIQQRATPLLAVLGTTHEDNPQSATSRSSIMAPSLYGLGLVEAVPAETILQRSDPDDSDGDGISGRAGRNGGGALGRFGRKSDAATLLEFVNGALLAEMGLTTPLSPEEGTINGVSMPAAADPAPDPEISGDELAAIVDFVRFLAPPNRLETPPAAADSLQRGERLFQDLGCSSCHLPYLLTGPSDIVALDRKRVDLYSDLLLHDLGPALADICGVAATSAEHRTARLMGLRYRAGFMHDGRASTAADAVLLHDGEARSARDAFDRLNADGRSYLMRFLLSL